jgi:hypothetical protein
MHHKLYASPKWHHCLSVLAHNGRAYIVPADSKIRRDRARESQRILLRSHANHALSISRAREYLNSQLDRITHHNEQRLWEAVRTLIRYMFEDDAICLAKIPPRRALCRKGRASCHNHNIRLYVANVRNHLDPHSFVVKRIHQINAGAKQFALGRENTMSHKQQLICWLEKMTAKNVNGESTAHRARGTQNCDPP